MGGLRLFYLFAKEKLRLARIQVVDGTAFKIAQFFAQFLHRFIGQSSGEEQFFRRTDFLQLAKEGFAQSHALIVRVNSEQREEGLLEKGLVHDGKAGYVVVERNRKAMACVNGLGQLLGAAGIARNHRVDPKNGLFVRGDGLAKRKHVHRILSVGDYVFPFLA
jgi:hypothetical protein